jgi:hypothetical protein
MELTPETLRALGAAFPEDEIEFLPRANSGGRALALAYIDARAVMRRLDSVVGAANWAFDFELVSPDGKMVKGKLTVCGVTKCDAGEASREDEILKSAVSDALKRCAVHFGIGRYLYYLPSVWAPYDSQKRQFTEQPRINPAAVAKALAICGVEAGPVQTPRQQQTQQRAVAAMETQRSIAPESRGDARAAQAAVGQSDSKTVATAWMDWRANRGEETEFEHFWAWVSAVMKRPVNSNKDMTRDDWGVAYRTLISQKAQPALLDGAPLPEPPVTPGHGR